MTTTRPVSKKKKTAQGRTFDAGEEIVVNEAGLDAARARLHDVRRNLFIITYAEALPEDRAKMDEIMREIHEDRSKL